MQIPPSRVSPFLSMQILERAGELEQQGRDIVHLEVGEPAFAMPPPVAEALAAAVRRGHSHYTHSLGRPELREAISRYYHRTYGVQVSPEHIIVTSGSSASLLLVLALLLEPGDEVLISDPGYACYPNFIRSLHGAPRRFALRAEQGFRLDPAELSALVTDRTRAVLVNSPSNPTGAVQPPDVLQGLAGLPATLISDEIYHGLTYGTPARTMLEFRDDCFVVDGFSKRYAMTGLRIGWLVAPGAAVPALRSLQQNLFICAGDLAQTAALAAIEEGEPHLREMLAAYRVRRDLLVSGLCKLGFRTGAPPGGAYYLLAGCDHLCRDSLALAHRLLEEAGVATAPGIDFGERAEGCLRFSFASAPETISEGLLRLERWIADQALRGSGASFSDSPGSGSGPGCGGSTPAGP